MIKKKEDKNQKKTGGIMINNMYPSNIVLDLDLVLIE